MYNFSEYCEMILKMSDRGGIIYCFIELIIFWAKRY